jgi:hypothetical protein
MYNQLKLTTCIKSRVGFLLFFEKLYLSTYLSKKDNNNEKNRDKISSHPY